MFGLSGILRRMIFIYVWWAATVQADLNVCLKDMGCLKGTIMPGYQIEEFEAFMGIPFAQPPVGELRLRNPLPALAWKGLLNATKPQQSCLQKNYFFQNWEISGAEDCLYLNVYRPKGISFKNSLPVMVYIHSGGFFCGSAHPGASGPEYFMDTQQVILVTIGYRLGAFGFLSTGDSHMPGNFGLKDQRLALQWVQQHIASFGGNRQSVTIFGHSAGGISAHYHMLSPNSKGLFHRAISLSGTAFLPSMSNLSCPLSQAQKIAEHVGIAEVKNLDTQQLAKALRQVNALKLVKAGDVLKQWDNMPMYTFRPVVEQEASTDSFFHENPLVSHLSGRIHQVPWLLGTSSRKGEGSAYLLRALDDPQLLEEFNQKFLATFGLTLSIPSTQLVNEVLHSYGLQKQALDNSTLAVLAEIAGDFYFQYPLKEAASTYAKYANLSENPLFIYSFEYRGVNTFSVHVTKGTDYDVGAAHMDDAIHVIRMPILFPDYEKESEDAKVVKRLTSLLVEFAKTGQFAQDVSLTPCQAADFTNDQMCHHLRFSGSIGVTDYSESVDKRVNFPAHSIWKKLFM